MYQALGILIILLSVVSFGFFFEKSIQYTVEIGDDHVFEWFGASVLTILSFFGVLVGMGLMIGELN
jgi:hypothetical protein